MLVWMIGIVGMTAILCAAAFFAERAARQSGRQRGGFGRWPSWDRFCCLQRRITLSAEWMSLSAMIFTQMALHRSAHGPAPCCCSCRH